MNSILIIGAGRSAGALISYLLKQADRHDWRIMVADADADSAAKRVQGFSNAQSMRMDIRNIDQRRSTIQNYDLVISLLPAFLHIEVARDCLEFKKHLITASYVSSEMHELAQRAKEQGILFMGEMGLDPGIDHMSAMKRIHHIQEKGGKISAFLSYTGGVIAPESDDNPWHYKFTWNPRNVVRAGQGTAQYLDEGKYKYIPYNRLFERYKNVEIQGFQTMEMYANRDSLLYRSAYNLDHIPTIVRGTLRYPGFCDAWNTLVKIGLTDGSYPIINSHNLTYREWLDAYLDPKAGSTIKERLASLCNIKIDGDEMKKLEYIDLFSDDKIKLEHATPADILESLLLDKWALQSEDKDLIVMQHEFHYELHGESFTDLSTMLLKGQNSEDTAMSRLVGLPLGIFVKHFMLGEIPQDDVDVHIPVIKEIYHPVLKELEEYNVVFKETTLPG